MKRLSALLCTVLLCLVSFGIADAENVIDMDMSQVNGSITYAQMIQVCNSPDAYAGKVFRLKGKFNYSETKEMARVIFSDRSGCCELSMMFVPEQTLVYPDDFPPLYSEILITAKLAVDQADPDMPCWFADAVLEWEGTIQ